MTIFSLARPLRWAVHLVVLSGLLLIPLGAPSAGRTSGTVGSLAAFSDKIDPAVLAAAAKSPDGRAYALVFFKEQADLSFARHMNDWNARGWAVYRALKGVADRTQKDVLAGLAARKTDGAVADYHSYWIVNLVTVRADADTLRWLAARPEVARIYPELKIEAPKPQPVSAGPGSPGTIEWNISKIGAPDVWATYNVTGTGTVVANVDTGVQYDHPALVNQYRGNLGGGNFDHNYNWWDPTHVYTYPFPIEDGHGTHVMGTEVGDDGAGNQIGVAPGAKWIAAYGCCPDNDALLSAEQFMIAPTDLNGNNPDPGKRPNVVNNSWGGPGGSLIFNGLIEAQRAAGVFPAYAAANSGSACGTMGSPGDNPAVGLSVGATDSNDAIAYFSSRGSNPFGGIGPDVSAPGVSIRSAWPPATYAVLSGTSMATPHVAGSVALIISAEPMMAGKIDQLEELLRRTAVGLTSSQTCGGVPGSQVPNNTYGWGRIDLKAAVDMVWHAGTLSGQVTDAGRPVAGATVSISRQLASGRTITLTQTTDANGNYSFVAGEGTYNVRVDAYGYNAMTTTGVIVAWGQATTQVFSLTALPVYTISGQVGDATLPIYLSAKVEALNVPGAVAITNPTDGQYSLALAPGTYTLRASSEPGYAPVTQVVTVTGNLTGVNFGLPPRDDYVWSDSRQPGGPTYEWIDITGSGTVWNAPDDGQLSVSIPGGFTYYGTNYATLYINSNGWVGFSAISPPSFIGGGNKMIPFEGPPNNAIYGLSEDLNASNGAQGQVYYQYLSDQNLYVIEYYQVQHWASGFPETFEIILNQTDNTVKVQYETVSWPDFTTVGVESSDGSYATVYSYANSARLEAGRAVLFTPKRGTPMNSLYLPIALQ